MDSTIPELIKGMLNGSEACLSRLITLVENHGPEASDVMRRVPPPHAHSAWRVGITGAPGVGKSTLTDQLVTVAREKGLSVGVVAVDPSSPRHGGAVLGDRIRMERHALDDKVFIRSMATRGCSGGIPGSTKDVIKLMDAFGKDLVIVETVGVGQTDCAVSGVSDVVVLVLSPESGDIVQCMKAGIMEIADIIVVNKADHTNAEAMLSALNSVMALDGGGSGQRPTIMAAQALNNVGIKELFQEIERRITAVRHGLTPET